MNFSDPIWSAVDDCLLCRKIGSSGSKSLHTDAKSRVVETESERKSVVPSPSKLESEYEVELLPGEEADR